MTRVPASPTLKPPPTSQAAQSPVVLHVRSVTGSGGGPEKTILNSPRYLAEFGWHPLCAYLHPPDDPGFEAIRNKAQELDVPLLEVPDRGPLDFRAVRALLEICRQQRVTIWHSHDYKTNAVGLLLKRFWPMRLVTTLHGWVKHTRRTPLYYCIDRHCLRYYDRLVCVSEDLLDLCRANRIAEARCVLIENAIEADRFQRTKDRDDAKRQLGFTPGRLLLGAVGRLSPEKGFDLLIRAVAELLDEGRDLELAIVGDGDQRGELERLIRQSAHADRMHLCGYQPEVIDFYHAMDCFVLSSLREGLPNVVLEALAMEVPVVATRVAGIPRILRHEDNGLIVAKAAPTEIAAALRCLLDDAALRQRLARAGRQTVVDGYGFDSRMARMRTVYEELLSASVGGQQGKVGANDDDPPAKRPPSTRPTTLVPKS